MKRLIFFLVISIITLSQDLSATHLVGSKISYETLGNGKIKIILEVYRDCLNGRPGFDNPAYVSVFDSDTNRIKDIAITNLVSIDTFPFIIQDSCVDTSNYSSYLCLERGVYEHIDSLNWVPGGLLLVYDRCCMPAHFTNVQNPLESGITITTFISDSLGLTKNHSSRGQPAKIDIACLNVYNSIIQTATDFDNDSLVYERITPYNSTVTIGPSYSPPLPPPYSELNYAPPFSYNNPFSGLPIIFDSISGIIQTGPSLVGTFVYGVRIHEYRGGTYLGYSDKVDFLVSTPNKFDTTTTKPPPSTGVADINDESPSIYPNPVSDLLVVDELIDMESRISLYSMNGEILQDEIFAKKKVELNLENLRSGIYILRIEQQGIVRHSKVIKK